MGKFWYSRIKYERKPSFLDYVVNGLDLKLMLAIDFCNCEKKGIDSGNDDIPQLIENLLEFVMEYDDEKEKTYPLFGLGNNFLKFNNGKCKYNLDDKRESQDKRDIQVINFLFPFPSLPSSFLPPFLPPSLPHSPFSYFPPSYLLTIKIRMTVT